MKIIARNIAGDVSDRIVCENINEYYGKRIVDLLNGHPRGAFIYMVVADDYGLYEKEGIR
jgi:hypothetical protein